jgi:hypothetical protein
MIGSYLTYTVSIYPQFSRRKILVEHTLDFSDLFIYHCHSSMSNRPINLVWEFVFARHLFNYDNNATVSYRSWQIPKYGNFCFLNVLLTTFKYTFLYSYSLELIRYQVFAKKKSTQFRSDSIRYMIIRPIYMYTCLSHKRSLTIKVNLYVTISIQDFRSVFVSVCSFTLASQETTDL